VNSDQTNPNKTKQKSLDFLGFIRPNRDFSMGYERKNKKIHSRLRLCAKRLKQLLSSLHGTRPREAAFDPAIENILARIPILAKQKSTRARGSRPSCFPCGRESIALSKIYRIPAFAGMKRKLATADRPSL
jgi:hypothetical protein